MDWMSRKIRRYPGPGSEFSIGRSNGVLRENMSLRKYATDLRHHHPPGEQMSAGQSTVLSSCLAAATAGVWAVTDSDGGGGCDLYPGNTPGSPSGGSGTWDTGSSSIVESHK